EGAPPVAGTWKMPAPRITNKMRPSLDHDPPQYTPETSQIFDIVSRDRSTLCKTPPAPKAIDLLSGDQNGRLAPSLPRIRRAFGASSGRTHKPVLPFTTPTKAAVWPSGETAKPAPRFPPPDIPTPSGGAIWNRMT